MITSKLWPRITGIVILILGSIILLYAFWPAETAPMAESMDAGRTLKGKKSDLETQPKAQHLEEKQTVDVAKPQHIETIQREKPNPKAEQLYQMALSYNKSGEPQHDRGYEIIIDCCWQILTQYPDSPQAKKARELLQEVPEQYHKQYEKEMILRYSSKPAVRKSRRLRRRR